MINQSVSRLFVVLLVILCVQIPATASETSESPLERYRVLNWIDLVPKGWKRPLIARAYDAVVAIDEDSVVKELDGQLAALPGYILPLVYEGDKVSEFLLVPFLPHKALLLQNTPVSCVQPHFEPNQKVYVHALEPVVVENRFKPIWIVGAMSLEPMMTDSGPAAYRMNDAVTTPYEY